MKKERADQLVVQQGLAETIDQAKRMIMAGQIYTEKHLRVDTAGEKLSVATELNVKGQSAKYVSRGGFKLEKALAVFQIDVREKTVLDIGSSTGGFTDAALQHGAALCYALDVGTNQLAWKLRSDDRVIVMEQTNFRTSQPEDFTHGRPDVASIDVSFISLKKILPTLTAIIQMNGDVLVLVKPQFEAKREEVGRHGIVRDPKVHERVLVDILSYAIEHGYALRGVDYSPITGGEGNIEYLVHLTRTEEPANLIGNTRVKDVVSLAHQTFYSS